MPAEINNDDNKKELQKKINLFLIDYFKLMSAGLGIVIFAIGMSIFIVPKYNKIKQETEVIRANKKEVLDRKIVYYNKLNNFVKSYNNISQEEKNKIDKMLPNNDNELDLMEEMELLLSQNGFSLDSIKITEQAPAAEVAASDPSAPPPPPPGPGVKAISLEAKISGIDDYNDFKKLLAVFESNIRILDVTGFEYSPDQEAITFKLNAYYYN